MVCQAVELLFKTKPSLTVEYCESFFPPKLEKWKDLLDMLLKTCTSTGGHTPGKPLPLTTLQVPSPETPLYTYISLYRGKSKTSHLIGYVLWFISTAALEHVVSFCSPEEFLTLLPSAGHLSFFLPFIEKSCKLHLSRTVSHHLSPHTAS